MDPAASFDLSEKDLQAAIREADLLTLSATPPLDLCWDLLCDVDTFQKTQLDRAVVHDMRRVTYQQTRKCSETMLLLGQVSP